MNFKYGEWVRRSKGQACQFIKIIEDDTSMCQITHCGYNITASSLTKWKPQVGDWVIIKNNNLPINNDKVFTVILWEDDTKMLDDFDYEPYIGSLPTYIKRNK